MRLARGHRVILQRNGGTPATVLDEYMPGMYDVRIFSGWRHVGDVVVCASEIVTGVCGDCGEVRPIHPDSADQRGEPICTSCAARGAFDA